MGLLQLSGCEFDGVGRLVVPRSEEYSRCRRNMKCLSVTGSTRECWFTYGSGRSVLLMVGGKLVGG